MKLSRFLPVLAATVLASATASAEVYNNSDFRRWRDYLRSGVTDFQATKYCERLEGFRVHFESHVYSVGKNGHISADMDGRELWSLPEINLMLLSEDQAEGVRVYQDIEYYGNILDCSFNSTTGVLSLVVANGRLVAHY